MKAVLTSLNTAFLPISRSRFKERETSLLIAPASDLLALQWLVFLLLPVTQASLLISVTTVWQCCVNFWAFWERNIFSERIG